MSENDTERLRIEKAIYGGEGLARLPDGKAVLVPLTLPGEVVEARLNGQRRGVAQAELTAVCGSGLIRGASTTGCAGAASISMRSMRLRGR
jgi:23S rRNA (uracil1939-C5)-methyltransferase